MELVTLFLTPTAIPLSPFSSLAAIQMFHQLYRIFVKLVEKHNTQDKKKAKRAHDDIDSGENSKSHLIAKSTTRDITVHILNISMLMLYRTCPNFLS